MIRAILGFVSELVPVTKLKPKGSKKVDSVGKKRPTYCTCEKRLSGATWDGRTIILITKTRSIMLSSTCVL